MWIAAEPVAQAFSTRVRLEAEAGVGLEHQRGGKLLLDEAAVHGAEEHLVDIGRRHPGIGKRALRHLDDQRFDVAPVVAAELAVRPADDTPAHLLLLSLPQAGIPS